MKYSSIGIDPGVNGGIALITPEYKWYAERFPRDRNPKKAYALFENMIMNAKNEGFLIRVFLEKVHAMPHDGRSSLFKFGSNYGLWIGIAVQYPITFVTPKKWQSHYGDLPKDKKERKNNLKELAIETVGLQLKPTLCTSDAILIAKYGKESPDGDSIQ